MRKDLERLARSVEDVCSEANVTVIVGDVSSSGRLEHVEEVLGVVKEIVDPIPVLVIPGNHDIYLTEDERSAGINSLLKLSLFNDLAEKLGCAALMKQPFVLNNIGFVGSIGWYDYSFAPDYLGLKIDDFRAKAFGLYIWADRDYVKLPFSDEEFTQHILNKFEEDIKQVYSSIDKIVAVLHHVPFKELVEYRLEPSWDYFSTFMGSKAFGYIIKKYSGKIKLVLHGHQHDGVETNTCRDIDGIKCCNCASPYPMIAEVY